MLKRASLSLVASLSLLTFSATVLADENVNVELSPAPSAVPAPAAPVLVEAPVAQPAAQPRPALVTRSRPTAGDADSDDEVEETKPVPGEWYGYQTLLVDGAGLGLAVGAARGGAYLALAGLATYTFGGPIVHAAHGHAGKFGIDLGVRVGAPLVGGVVGIGLGCLMSNCGGHGDFSGYGGIFGGVVGLAVGGVTAIVIDAAVIAKEPGAPRTKAWDGKPIVAPQVAAMPGGGAVGVGGAF